MSAVKGTYALLLRLDNACNVLIGAFGAFNFPAGWYLYLGSARGPGGLPARLTRHRRRGHKRFHWHIDYLRAVAALVEIWSGLGEECDWVAAAAALPAAEVIVPRFGASDCHCPAHLFHYPRRPAVAELETRLQLVLACEVIGE